MSSRKPPRQPGLFDLVEARRADPAGQTPPAAAARVEPKTWSVSELVRTAARTLEARYGVVWVEGEVSNLSMPRSGHVYFTLKDQAAQLPAVMFKTDAARLKFRVEDGLKVRARGRLSIYDAQGKFQLYADALEPAGLGAQQLAFEQLKRKLAAEGLFDAARKRPLPGWPRVVGVATSATGAVIRDIWRVAERRGRVRVLLAPCQVQGEPAVPEIIAAIRRLERRPEMDVIVVARGGGSAEDLAAFNDERLARAIAACRVPVVSAVGHEVDFTIADLVADHRAPTPSAAAELVVPLFAEAQARRDELDARLLRAGRRVIAEARLKLDGGETRAAAALKQVIARRRRVLDELQRKLASLHPRARLSRDRALLDGARARLAPRMRQLIDARRRTLDDLRRRLEARMRQALEARRRAFAGHVGKLDALSPLSVLERGYALARTADGAVLTGIEAVQPGDPISVRLSRGELDCVIKSISGGPPADPAD